MTVCLNKCVWKIGNQRGKTKMWDNYLKKTSISWDSMLDFGRHNNILYVITRGTSKCVCVCNKEKCTLFYLMCLLLSWNVMLPKLLRLFIFLFSSHAFHCGFKNGDSPQGFTGNKSSYSQASCSFALYFQYQEVWYGWRKSINEDWNSVNK